MPVDYVVISSDQNPLYREFLPLVTREWNRIGLKVMYLEITLGRETLSVPCKWDGVHIAVGTHGLIDAAHAKMVRLEACEIAEMVLNENVQIMISDIDMIPLNKEYFCREFERCALTLLTPHPYEENPFPAMCYVIHDSCTASWGSGGFSLCRPWMTSDNIDEAALYCTMLGANRLYAERRDLSTRVDRSDWRYDVGKLKQGYYIDAHLPRPYSQHKEAIDRLIQERWD